eukprot:CAMPEP_0174821030 /NCGR_PEP_ID=MMETSP1107-20130205/5280_1 /TAXON_ID=36770 /ORGANISM="Paraphysomonas vestita, Strain GFlagA" /LENGTH=753 /DNA_ID=CAMNT_0016037601 /DNA_START=353 /DNA_END=2614 /DNA_ORIENTATION=+
MKSNDERSVDLESVTRIQHGQMTSNFARHSATFGAAAGNSFSIMYGDNRSLDLIAPSPEVFRTWFLGIKQILKEIRKARLNSTVRQRYLKAKWDQADADQSGTLAKSEVLDLVHAMNISRPKKQILALYREVDVDGSNTLDFQEFVKFIDLLERRVDLQFLWNTINAGPHTQHAPLPIPAKFGTAKAPQNSGLTTNDRISIADFIRFWEANQHRSLSEQEAIELISGAMGEDFDKENPSLTFNGFTTLMTSAKNDGFDFDKQSQYQDMTLPLSYYFMASSHNTYLEEDQLYGPSSVNRYINDVIKSCRCVELDCWDGDAGEPIIYHGFTLTSKILFRDVINAIAQYSFRTSPYPVVLSLENHCSLPQQAIMAEILRNTLGSALLMPGELLTDTLPSLEQLKGKVLIKGKRLSSAVLASLQEGKGDDDDDDDSDDDDDDDDDDSDDDEPTNDDGTKKQENKQKKKEDKENSRKAVKELKEKRKQIKIKTHPELSALTYLGTCHYKSFSPEHSQSVPPDMMTSYSESKTKKLLRDPATVNGWIEHNKIHLSRIYPKGTRVDSSNLDPCPPWSAGNQLVALNYQTPCVQMHLNDSKFRENGNCGYVLKPNYMLQSTMMPKSGFRLVVNVISAQRLPKPEGETKGEVIDPYVIVSLYGPQSGSPTASFRTKVISDNGFDPIWNENFTFDINKPESTQLYFKIMDADLDRDDFIAYSSIPVDCIAMGYRTLKLFDNHGLSEGAFQFAGLFVRLSVEEL